MKNGFNLYALYGMFKPHYGIGPVTPTVTDPDTKMEVSHTFGVHH